MIRACVASIARGLQNFFLFWASKELQMEFRNLICTFFSVGPAPSWRRIRMARSCALEFLFVAHIDLDLAAQDIGWCFELTVSLGDRAVCSTALKKAALRHAWLWRLALPPCRLT